MVDDEQTLSLDTHQWLQQRQRSGNWIDVAETDEIPPDVAGPQRTMLHIFQIAFAPEIRRRLSKKEPHDSFFLTAAQLIQPEEGGTVIRLNDEVRGLLLVRANRSVNTGDSVLVSDLNGFESFDLADDELDAAHFTMFWDGDRWI